MRRAREEEMKRFCKAQVRSRASRFCRGQSSDAGSECPWSSVTERSKDS